MGGLNALERPLVHWITCHLQVPGLQEILLWSQDKVVAVPFALLALLVIAWRDPRSGLRALLTCLIGFGIAMGLASLIRAAVDRQRPPWTFETVLEGEEAKAGCATQPESMALHASWVRSRAFPSRHGLTIGVFVTALCLAWGQMAWVAIPYGLIAAVGRVYAGKHWPSDVLVGALLGALVAWGTWALLPRLFARFGLAPWVQPQVPDADSLAG